MAFCYRGDAPQNDFCPPKKTFAPLKNNGKNNRNNSLLLNNGLLSSPQFFFWQKASILYELRGTPYLDHLSINTNQEEAPPSQKTSDKQYSICYPHTRGMLPGSDGTKQNTPKIMKIIFNSHQ